jgi:hypothetical protein
VKNRRALERANLQPRHRIVLLGASNLTRGISTVIESSQNIWGSPLDVCCALGHGRSYGWTSNFLGRSLPGIVDCGLWKALEERPKLPTAALITDIGNDLMYGAPVPQIARWVETAIERLQRADAKVVMTLLPLSSASRLSPARFRFFAKLFFPHKQLDLADLLARAHDLHARLEALGRSRGVALVEQRSQWYGIDPIHIRLRCWRTVWPEILASCRQVSSRLGEPTPGDEPVEPRVSETLGYVKGSLRRWLYLRTRTAENWQFFGTSRKRTQPCATLKGGTSVSFF